ncbi:MAG TPA: Gfo/Idh/MocA family oxidoreductase [Methylomirabilota bacterium]|jgi:predicted dehydrogenase|nr:Gfo/Idh/MocA family oxidoreductase [Methylomirabilota bacterium]
MASRLRVGVIGTGFGSLVQIPAFRAHPRAEVVAVASGTPGKAKKAADAFGVPHAYDDWRKLVAAELDLVSITTPPALHHAMALAAHDAGRHVLCEKPMAMSAAESEDMLAHGERARRIHVIDHELRFNPNRRKARALIEEGFVGTPRHALLTAVNASRLDPAKPWGWWFDEARGGGLLGAVGSHQVDLLRYWLGDIAAVSGSADPVVPERPLPDGSGRRRVTADEFTTFSLRFLSGAVGTVFLSCVAAHGVGPRIEVWGDEGYLLLDAEDRLWGARQGQALAELTEPETLKPVPGMEYVSLWSVSFIRLADHLVSAALDGAPVAPAATFRDGLAVQRVLDAVRKATRSGWVEV